MDTIDWSQNRFEEVCNVLAAFLQKQVGFEKVTFVPVSGLLGVNLVKQVDSTHPLAKWYQGPSLVTVLGVFTL
jgi:translation elongation factor EF-1alpha